MKICGICGKELKDDKSNIFKHICSYCFINIVEKLFDIDGNPNPKKFYPARKTNSMCDICGKKKGKFVLIDKDNLTEYGNLKKIGLYCKECMIEEEL